MNGKCNIDELRCLVELHSHLDGALSPENCRQLAAIQGIEIPESEEELKSILMVDSDCRDLNEFLQKFEFPGRLLQTKEGISQAVYNLQEEMVEAGYIYGEIRFAPQLSTLGGLSQEEVVLAAIDGIERMKKKLLEEEPQSSEVSDTFRAALILCSMRGFNTREANLETVHLAKKYLGKGVCATDLAGAEALFPTGDYGELFELAKSLGVPYTIHAGEADGPGSVQSAIDFGAMRIGHGVRAFENMDVVKQIAEKKIPMEVCPTSNLLTCIYKDIQEYPLRKIMELGIPVSVNTDDMVVCNTNLRAEWKLLIDTFSLTCEEVRDILLQSADSSFASEETKAWMRDKILPRH